MATWQDRESCLQQGGHSDVSLTHGGSVHSEGIGRSWVEAMTEPPPAPESWTEHPGGAGAGRKQR